MGEITAETNPDASHWADKGLCRRVETIDHADFFYEGRFVTGSHAKAQHEARLRAICRACPVFEQCDEYADEIRAEGFWAGLTHKERESRRRKRKRAS